jgi:spermidine synthase
VSGNKSPARALIIGLAGGTAARQLHAAYPEVTVDGVEIDQKIADVGREYFGLTEDVANVTIADGRYALETSDATYDLICLDAYRQPYVPFHLATVEFFQLASDHLRPNGVVVVNAGRTDRDFRLVDALATTLGKVFETVIAIDVDRYENTMLFATHADISIGQVKSRLRSTSSIPLIDTVSNWALDRGNIRVAANDGAVFTDDKAPVEWIIDQIIFDEAVREDQ